MKRSEKCELFLKHNEVSTCSLVDDNDEGHFSRSGCDCCETDLGNTVFDCHGYSDQHKQIFELGKVCGECLRYFANGVDHPDQDEELG